MKNIIFGLITFILALLFNLNFLTFAKDDLKSVLDDTTKSLWDRIYKIDVSKWWSASKVKTFFVETIWKKIMIPIIISIWLLLWFIAFYKLKFSDKVEEQTKQ
jgi:hypothetical protein